MLQARVARVGNLHDRGSRGSYRDRARASPALHPQRQQACHAFLHQQAVAWAGDPGFEHGMRGAHAGMSRERHLTARTEHADAVARFRRGRLEHEGGLWQARPARYGLHGRIVEALRIEHHCQGIAGAGALGEDVDLHEAACGHEEEWSAGRAA